MPTEKPRITIVLSDETLDLIEEYRFSNRFPNRSAAVVSLIKKGLSLFDFIETTDRSCVAEK